MMLLGEEKNNFSLKPTFKKIKAPSYRNDEALQNNVHYERPIFILELND